jgi:hypothetical protein
MKYQAERGGEEISSRGLNTKDTKDRLLDGLVDK